MSKSHEFLTLIKNNKLFDALEVVMFEADKQVRVEKCVEFMKQSSMSTYVVAIRQFDELLRNYKDDHQRLSLEISRITIGQTSWHDRMFATARANILSDIIYNNPECANSAVSAIIQTYKHRDNAKTDEVFKAFLINLAALVWPESSLIGALYG